MKRTQQDSREGRDGQLIRQVQPLFEELKPTEKKFMRTIPAFLNKLYSMVNDPFNKDFIHWSESGASFIVPNHEAFAKNILARYYKHSNFTSFIRQLNMYGFSKVQGVQQGSLLSGALGEIHEYENPNFHRDHPDRLCFVIRRKSTHTEETVPDGMDVNNIIQEIAAIKRHQMTISTELQKMQAENQVVFQESLSLQDRYAKQQDTIEKILSFLASVFSSKKPVKGRKKRRLYIESGDHDADQEETEEDDEEHQENVNRRVIELLGQTALSVPPKNQLISSSRLNTLSQSANEVADDIDLLQDRLHEFPSLMGLPNQELESWPVHSDKPLPSFQGSDEDHQTLLALIQNPDLLDPSLFNNPPIELEREFTTLPSNDDPASFEEFFNTD